MRYTSQAAMEHQGLRDVERWKDKIEVRLDNRQVAFLFFGSALCACMLFILGVIVGKRLESRGRAMAPEIEDPLALLDRVAASSGSSGAGASDEPTPPGARPRRAPTPAAEVKSGAARPERAAERPVNKPADRPLDKRTGPGAEAKAIEAKPVEAKAVEAKGEVAKAQIPPEAATSPTRGKPRFMLQVGSFPMRAEAEAFAATFAGDQPVVVPWEVPGKGLWYRVRIGSFQSFKEAIDAKIVFEKKHNKIALVIGPL